MVSIVLGKVLKWVAGLFFIKLNLKYRIEDINKFNLEFLEKKLYIIMFLNNLIYLLKFYVYYIFFCLYWV